MQEADFLEYLKEGKVEGERMNEKWKKEKNERE
jgi:hypothetical protein